MAVKAFSSKRGLFFTVKGLATRDGGGCWGGGVSAVGFSLKGEPPRREGGVRGAGGVSTGNWGGEGARGFFEVLEVLESPLSQGM